MLGFFPSIKGDVNSPIFRTKENFGSGAQSYNAIIISKEIYSVLVENKVKGVEFYPISE